MPTATVQYVVPHSGAHAWRQPTVHERDVAVRVGMQGFGSVELDCTDIKLDLNVYIPFESDFVMWATLDEVLRHPQVRGVTFRGPWT
jgi:hypothetical protein